ncbi:MAG TPA: metallophosphoesterase, partial [Methanophagales archaeon]|nr:metallophosphoesterase [Methanophagales archaeon]
MRVVHISDIHVAEQHFLPELLERVIKEINKIEPEIVVVTGDLTENGHQSEFKRAKSHIEKIECDKKVV